MIALFIRQDVTQLCARFHFLSLQCGGDITQVFFIEPKYFYINRSKDGKLEFVRNFKAIDEELRCCGFFLIAETDFKKTTAEILEIYRRRDVIEKSFDNLKNELDMKRLILICD